MGVVFALLLFLTAIAAGLALDLYPWSLGLVLGVAAAGGVGLGRLMPARSRPWLLLLVVLSLVDLVQVALTSGASVPGPRTGQGPLIGQYLNLRLLLPWGRSNIGLADLLLAAAIGEFWRRAGAPLWVAPLPAIFGLGLAELFATAAGIRDLALVPFLTLGWLITAAGHRWSLGLRAHPTDSSSRKQSE